MRVPEGLILKTGLILVQTIITNLTKMTNKIPARVGGKLSLLNAMLVIIYVGGFLGFLMTADEVIKSSQLKLPEGTVFVLCTLWPIGFIAIVIKKIIK